MARDDGQGGVVSDPWWRPWWDPARGAPNPRTVQVEQRKGQILDAKGRPLRRPAGFRPPGDR